MNVGCSFDMKGGAVGLYVRPSALHSINREPRNNRPARLLIPPACLPACLPFCVAVGNYEIELLEKQGQLMVRVFPSLFSFFPIAGSVPAEFGESGAEGGCAAWQLQNCASSGGRLPRAPAIKACPPGLHTSGH